jgi:hypothetical protein
MPKTISFDRFDFGLDLRKGLSTSDANRLRVLKNAHATEGRTIRKRPGTVKIATLEAGTEGLFAGNGKLNTFYGGTAPITHANTLFKANNVQNPVTPALTLDKVHYGDVFNGFMYAAVEYAGGQIKHHYIDNPGTFPATAVVRLGSYFQPASPNGLRYKVTDVSIGDTAWTATAAKALNAFVRPTTSNSFRYECTTAGTTGATEPVWPVTAGLTVTDGTVIWTCRDTNTTGAAPVYPSSIGGTVNTGGVQLTTAGTAVEDANCPHTEQVTKISSKLWSVGVNGDVVRFCATNSPRDWTTANDAGFLPVGLQQSGANEATALGFYSNRLVVLFADSSQIWNVDVDPALHAFLQAVDVGSTLPYSHANMGGDVFFLSPAGVRTITRQDVTTNLIDADVGSPIDRELLNGEFITIANAKAQYYRGGGQYWLYSGNKAVVYTFSRTASISAWSVYEFPFTLDYMDELNAELYIRSGDDVYRLDRTVKTDDGEIYSVDIELAYLDFKAPGVLKQITAMDAVVSGQCQISHRYDPRSTELVTNPPVTIQGDSRPGYLMPVELCAVSIAPVIRNFDDDEFELHQLTYYYESLGNT